MYLAGPAARLIRQPAIITSGKGTQELPNGGSDNCGTCGFNRKNMHEAGLIEGNRHMPPGSHCDIRDEPIDDPGYTYCANHPRRRSLRDPIPVGPILAAEAVGLGEYERVPLKPSPDTEEIRRHLLDLLDEPEERDSQLVFPILPTVMYTVIWQLAEFRERRALERLRRIEKDVEGRQAEFIREMIERIEGKAGVAEA